jgi:hypothetical protein
MSNWVDCPLSLQVLCRNLVRHIIIEGWVHYWKYMTPGNFQERCHHLSFPIWNFFLKATILSKCSYIYLWALHIAFVVLCG